MTDLDKFVKQEERNVIKDIYEYLPIRGVLGEVMEFIRVNIKREWKIVKQRKIDYQVKYDEYPIFINQVELHTDGNIKFDVLDQAFSSKDVASVHNREDIAPYVVYLIDCKYSIGSLRLEINYRNIFVNADHIDWDIPEFVENDFPPFVSEYECYMDYVHNTNRTGFIIDGKYTSNVFVEHTEQNCIITNCLILYNIQGNDDNDNYTIHEDIWYD